MRQPQRRADTIAVGMLVRDQQNALRRLDHGQRILDELRIQLRIQPARLFTHERFLHRPAARFPLP